MTARKRFEMSGNSRSKTQCHVPADGHLRFRQTAGAHSGGDAYYQLLGCDTVQTVSFSITSPPHTTVRRVVSQETGFFTPVIAVPFATVTVPLTETLAAKSSSYSWSRIVSEGYRK
jgi:hypothetical protein